MIMKGNYQTRHYSIHNQDCQVKEKRFGDS